MKSMLSLKSRYALKQIKSDCYATLSFSGNSSTKHHMLTDEEFKAGKQGYIFAPYIVYDQTIELPPYILAAMKRDSLRKKLEKLKKNYGD